MEIVPCKDCVQRKESCHSDCDKYKAWKKESDDFRDLKHIKKCYYCHNEFSKNNVKF